MLQHRALQIAALGIVTLSADEISCVSGQPAPPPLRYVERQRLSSLSRGRHMRFGRMAWICVLAAASPGLATAADSRLVREIRAADTLVIETRGARVDVSVWERDVIRIVAEPTDSSAVASLDDVVTLETP